MAGPESSGAGSSRDEVATGKGEVNASFDSRADGYDESEMHRWVAAQSADVLVTPTAAQVLDAAAGTALAGRRILQHDGSARVVAVDVSPRLLVRGREADARVLLVQADITALPLATAQFDAVLCVSALAHVAEPAGALREFARDLRPRGRLAVQVWAADGLLLPNLFRRAATSIDLSLPDPKGPLGQPAALRTALERAGLMDIDIAERTWTGPVPIAQDAWDGLVTGPTGAAIRDLSEARRALAREHFVQSVVDERRRGGEDTQARLIATATWEG